MWHAGNQIEDGRGIAHASACFRECTRTNEPVYARAVCARVNAYIYLHTRRWLYAEMPQPSLVKRPQLRGRSCVCVYVYARTRERAHTHMYRYLHAHAQLSKTGIHCLDLSENAIEGPALEQVLIFCFFVLGS